jgi:hypothetical protein
LTEQLQVTTKGFAVSSRPLKQAGLM